MTSENPVPPRAGPPRTRKPNYNILHAQPLPLTISPLPPLIPHNPLSLLYVLYAYLFQRIPAHLQPLHKGVFDPSTRSVHVTDPESIKAFWNHGFFGKGSLSRSEPTWLARRRRALGVIGKDEALTAEEITERRRKERREFKQERARAEKERIQRQLAEEGKLQLPPGSSELPGLSGSLVASTVTTATTTPNSTITAATAASIIIEEDRKSDAGSVRSVHFAPVEVKPSQLLASELDTPDAVTASTPQTIVDVEDLEHLQLTLEEAVFLACGLGVLSVSFSDSQNKEKALDGKELLDLARRASYFPTLPQDGTLQPDDPFLLNYVVYHHFRSLGWVVKAGIKFGVDYLLYNRGPVFSHAEFGVVVMPSYSHPYWKQLNDPARQKREQRPWHWLHCVNRVSAQVKKTVILVYVEVPPPDETDEGRAKKGRDEGLVGLLKRYSVREVSLRRWLVSRNRD